MKVNTTHPGKFPVKRRKIRNKVNTIKKLSKLLISTIIGRQIRGKLIFLIKFACSRNTFCERIVISEKKLHVNTPAQRWILYAKVESIPCNLVRMTCEKIRV